MNRASIIFRKRHGVLKTEAILATFILVAAMGFASTMVHRINRIWTDTQHHQFAISELSNQIDSVARLTVEQANDAIDSIEVSEACQETLKDASISGEIVADELGSRVTLKLTWDDRKGANPVELSAWLRNTTADGGRQ